MITQKNYENIGVHDCIGLKQGFGIEKFKDNSKFKGIFKDNKVTGWGIYEHRDRDVYKGNILMIVLMVMENISMRMVLFIMEIGLMINNLVLDMKYGMILLNIQVNIIMEKRKELVHIFGRIKLFI